MDEYLKKVEKLTHEFDRAIGAYVDVQDYQAGLELAIDRLYAALAASKEFDAGEEG